MQTNNVTGFTFPNKAPSGAIQCPMCQRGEPCLDNEQILRQKELEGQIQWFLDLKSVIESGDTETALITIDGALDLIDRQKGEIYVLDERRK